LGYLGECVAEVWMMRILLEPPSSRGSGLGWAKASGGRPGWTNRRRAGRIG